MPEEADFLSNPINVCLSCRLKTKEGTGEARKTLAGMDKSRMLTISAALGFCVAGISIVHAETTDASCAKYAWPNYPQQCLITSDAVGDASAKVRVAVANPAAESDTPDRPARPVDLRFDDRNYFDPTPAYAEQLLVPAVIPASFFKG